MVYKLLLRLLMKQCFLYFYVYKKCSQRFDPLVLTFQGHCLTLSGYTDKGGSFRHVTTLHAFFTTAPETAAHPRTIPSKSAVVPSTSLSPQSSLHGTEK